MTIETIVRAAASITKSADSNVIIIMLVVNKYLPRILIMYNVYV